MVPDTKSPVASGWTSLPAHRCVYPPLTSNHKVGLSGLTGPHPESPPQHKRRCTPGAQHSSQTLLSLRKFPGLWSFLQRNRAKGKPQHALHSTLSIARSAGGTRAVGDSRQLWMREHFRPQL